MQNKRLLKRIYNRISRTYTRISYKRKSRLYCVGAAKTGTYSIASMFDRTIRSGHESDSEHIIDRILDFAEGRIQELDIVSYIRKRDERLCLDVDSSQLNVFLLQYLLKEFPEARYLLTARDCYSWLDSFVNHSLSRNASEGWIRLREYRFRASELSHPPEEHPLKEKGLFGLGK